MKKLFFLFTATILVSITTIQVFGYGVSATSLSNTWVQDPPNYTGYNNVNPDVYYRFNLYHVVIGDGAKSTATVLSDYQYQRYFSTEVEGETGKRKWLGSYYDSKYIKTAVVKAIGGPNGYAKAWITW